MKYEKQDEQDSQMIKALLELLSPQYKQVDDLTLWLKELAAYSRHEYDHTINDLMSQASLNADDVYAAWDSGKDAVLFLDELMADEYGAARKRAGIGNFGKSSPPNTKNINNPFG